ncbi:MAG: TlpA disulfide reductase family protein [Desulfobacterales bacterium]|nr:TlpA disulfide reductase family protein [Desulfobacterales bacterium]MDD4072328.1 TlpA disulfide reductase family protein [Desulfobacterales bacterium]MDD4392404.1 TlpA disulfide reductase family protein [Desulfobacterales bacterium]
MKCLINSVFFAICLFAFPNLIYGKTIEPQIGHPLPDITLKIPDDDVHRTYLGLKGSDSFQIPQIRSRVVIIEIFSMYCPHCQRHAPSVNQLYQRIQKSGDFRDKIKIIGIGAGNSPFEVDFFRKSYAIPFPLFPDTDLSIHDKIGQVLTPYFIAVRIEPDGTNRIVYTQLGGFNNPDNFLDTIVKRSGLK